MGKTVLWGAKKYEHTAKQKLLSIKNDEMRQQFKQKPINEVRQMLARHGMKLVRGRGIFQV